MGRPPIGKVAMTSTERVRRFRAKQRADKPETKLETKQSAADSTIAKLEAEINTLKRGIADRQYYLDRALKAHGRIQHALGRFRAGKGVASAKAFRVIDLCLHPDTRGQVTDKQIESAMVIWNWCREILVGKDEKKPAAKQRPATPGKPLPQR